MRTHAIKPKADIFSNKETWKRVKFGDVVSEAKQTLIDSNNVQHVIGLEHIEPLDIHIRSWNTPEKETTFTRKFKKGQVLFGRRRAYQRKAAFAEFDGICSGDIIVLESKENLLNPELLPFIVHSDRFYKWAVSTSAGSLSPRTKFKHLAEFEFLLPPQEIQQDLVKLLMSIDSLMEKSRASLHSAEQVQLIQTRDIFSTKKTNSVIRIEDIGVVRAGYGFPHSLQGRSEGDYPFVKVSDMNLSTKYTETATNYIDKNDLVRLKAKLFPGETIIFPKVGAAIYTNKKRILKQPSLIDNNVMGVTLTKDGYLSEFLFYFFVSLDLGRIATTGALPAISASIIKELEIPKLSINEQRNVVDRLLGMDEYIESQNLYIKQLLQLRQSFINKIHEI